ncbi:nuclear transport factor 2 family protein [Paraburkholderia sp.]|jgi:hypothetical protein|uniref:nuclear transport factor 2 family protein n=1 Tax=Paraburkholderia sp. TaxID=1926495 RepID=UPI003C65E18E
MEQELSGARDAQAVLNVVHSYAWGYDENDAERLSSVFAEDAVSGGRVADAGTGWGPWKGRRAIVEGLHAIREHQIDRRRHQLSTPVFLSLTESEAVVNVYLSLLGVPKGVAPRLVTTGHYRASLRKFDDAWKIVALDAELDGPF